MKLAHRTDKMGRYGRYCDSHSCDHKKLHPREVCHPLSLPSAPFILSYLDIRCSSPRHHWALS